MRFVTFVKRCDTPTMIRCMMEAFEYFGGLPQAALTDRMKSVFLEMDGKIAKWNPVFADFMASIGVSPRVCKAYTPQTKGKVKERLKLSKKASGLGCVLQILMISMSKHACGGSSQPTCSSYHPENPDGFVGGRTAATFAQSICLGTFWGRRTARELGWVYLL